MSERKRYVGRFSKEKAELKHKGLIPTEIDPYLLKISRYYRKMYAVHGKNSGVDAGLCWPTKSQLNSIIEHEKTYDLTLEQKIQMFVDKQRETLKKFTNK